MSSEQCAPVGLVLAVGSLAVATNVRICEPAGPTRDRMARAVDSMREELRADAARCATIGDSITSLSRLVERRPEPERRALLIELAVANPFSPYWFAMRGEREVCRVHGLMLIAALSLGLEPDSVVEIATFWPKIARRRVAIAADGPAGPSLWSATPAAVGRRGPAAVSAGLAQLGFGTIEDGALGLAAGQWLLAAADTSSAPDALDRLVATPGAAPALRVELAKLLLTVTLATRRAWFDASPDMAERAIGHLRARVDAELEDVAMRNGAKAPRMRELRRLISSIDEARAQLRRIGRR